MRHCEFIVSYETGLPCSVTFQLHQRPASVEFPSSGAAGAPFSSKASLTGLWSRTCNNDHFPLTLARVLCPSRTGLQDGDSSPQLSSVIAAGEHGQRRGPPGKAELQVGREVGTQKRWGSRGGWQGQWGGPGQPVFVQCQVGGGGGESWRPLFTGKGWASLSSGRWPVSLTPSP